VAPAGQPDLRADVALAQNAAGVGSIAVHGYDSSLDVAGRGTCSGALVKNMNGSGRPAVPAPESGLDSVLAICTLDRPHRSAA
jgi:hypothetical protein